MAAASFFRTIFLNHFVKPACERQVFRSLSTLKPQRIVEVGMDSGDRAVDLIELAQRHRPTVEIQYTGLDLFDARSDEDSLKLKDTLQFLRSTGAKVRLIPGPPLNSLSRVANELQSTDLLVLSFSAVDADQLDWYYIPRMLHEHSMVFWQDQSEQSFRKLRLADVAALAQASDPQSAGDRKKVA